MRRVVSVTARTFSNEAAAKAKYDHVVALRQKYQSASLGTFTAYDEPLVLERGEMQYMYDVYGKKYIDLLGQNLCISVGHAHPKVTKAAMDQMTKIPHCTTMYYHEQPAELAKMLVERMPKHPSGEDWVVHFVCTGSEAVDLAVQMARVYTGHNQVVGLYKAYHGLQGYAAALTAIGKKAEQDAFSGMFTGVARVSSTGGIEELENFYTFGCSGRIAAFIAEPLQGYGGIFPLQRNYLSQAFDLARKNGGVAIADEVQTGLCRTGDSYWGFQDELHGAAIPDMITIGKGIGNGVGILGAVIAKRSIGEAFASRMWFNTYASNPVACAAGRAVLEAIDNDKLRENCQRQGRTFNKRLGDLCTKYPQVLAEIRGKGLFQGLQITGASKELSTKHALEIHRRLRKHGVVLGRGSALGNVFRVQPPMCIQEPDVVRVCDMVELVTKEYVAEHKL